MISIMVLFKFMIEVGIDEINYEMVVRVMVGGMMEKGFVIRLKCGLKKMIDVVKFLVLVIELLKLMIYNVDMMVLMS